MTRDLNTVKLLDTKPINWKENLRKILIEYQQNKNIILS